MRTEKEILEICLKIAKNMWKNANMDGFGNCVINASDLKELISLLHVLN